MGDLAPYLFNGAGLAVVGALLWWRVRDLERRTNLMDEDRAELRAVLEMRTAELGRDIARMEGKLDSLLGILGETPRRWDGQDRRHK